MELAKNVLGTPLRICCMQPETGFFRNGMCDTCEEDFGSHTVCILATEKFLEFSRWQELGISSARHNFLVQTAPNGHRHRRQKFAPSTSDHA